MKLAIAIVSVVWYAAMAIISIAFTFTLMYILGKLANNPDNP